MPHLRESSADLYRLVAIAVVVIGHWLVSAVTYRDGAFGNDYPLDVMPWTRWLTLLFQVVPVFFLVGGYGSATSWTHWREAGGRRGADWVRRRLGVILGPTTVYAAVALAVVAVLAAVGVERSALAFGGWAVAMHLWFVPVFLVVVALTPVAMAADRRWGLLVPAGLAVAIAAVDATARLTGVAGIGAVNYLLCWCAVYQLGICWQAGRFGGRRPLVMCVGGVVAVVALLGLRWYPVSMVGAPGAGAQNNFPPNLALFAFSAAQAGLLIAAAPAVTRRVDRSRLRRPLAVANANVMALYLWQMVPVVVVALIAYPAGLLPQPAAGSGAWWALRVLWVLILSVVAAAELAAVWLARSVTGRALPEVRTPLPPWCTTPLLFIGTALSVAALASLAVHGFAPSGRFPAPAVLALVAGVVMSTVCTVERQRVSVGQSQDPARY